MDELETKNFQSYFQKKANAIGFKNFQVLRKIQSQIFATNYCVLASRGWVESKPETFLPKSSVFFELWAILHDVWPLRNSSLFNKISHNFWKTSIIYKTSTNFKSMFISVWNKRGFLEFEVKNIYSYFEKKQRLYPLKILKFS